jgi:hypothetical protein
MEESMALPGSTRRRFPPKVIGPARIVSRTFSIWWGSLPQLLAIAALVHVPLLGLKWWLHEGEEGSWRATFLGFLPALNFAVFPDIIEGLAVLLIFQRVRGEPVDLGRSIRQGSRRIGTILAIAAVVSVLMLAIPTALVLMAADSASRHHGLGSSGVTQGTIFVMSIAILIVLLLYVLVFCIPIPAAIVEGHGPFAALNRSRLLTRGSRLRIFGTWLLFGLTTVVPGLILQAILKAIENPTTQLLAGSGVDWFVAALGCVLPIVLYHDLRETKEGIGIEELLKVFE